MKIDLDVLEPTETLLAQLPNPSDYVQGLKESNRDFRARVLCGIELAAARRKERSEAMTVAQLAAELTRLMAAHPEIADRPVEIDDCGSCGCGYPSYLDADAVAALCGLEQP